MVVRMSECHRRKLRGVSVATQGLEPSSKGRMRPWNTQAAIGAPLLRLSRAGCVADRKVPDKYLLDPNVLALQQSHRNRSLRHR